MLKPPLPNPSSISLFMTFFAILTKIPISFCSGDPQYSNCQQSISCEGLAHVKVKYPFYGVNRAEYCGLPGFLLECIDHVPKITIMSNRYRIININPSARTLTVAREDYWETICPATYKDTTINTSIFSYVNGVVNLVLYYGCTSSASIPGISHPLECERGDMIINVFFLVQPGNNAVGPEVGGCSGRAMLKVSQDSASALAADAAMIHDVVDNGFVLQWNLNNTECDRCIGSGGQCGRNLMDGQFRCFCRQGPYSTSCPGSSSTSNDLGKTSDSKTMKLGVAIGAAGIVGILIGGGFYCLVHRKKKVSKESKTNDLPISTSSRRSIMPSTTNFSESAPSFSSRSDIGKGSTYFGVQVFSYTELAEATHNFDPSRELGDGGFGTVYYGNLKDGREVAVKRLFQSNFKCVEQFMNEVELLARIRHQNLVTLYGCTSRRSRELLLVYEYVPNGTVADHLHGKRAKSNLLKWPVRLSIAIETAHALAHLHASDIIHRDVKTKNILLDNEFHVKVADFGLSRLLPNDATHVSTAPQGTPGYVDPEYYQYFKLTDKSDVYSFGVVLIELISSLQALDTDRQNQDANLANMAMNKILNHALHELVDPCLGFEKDCAIRNMTTSVAELAFRCLQQERDMRPSMDEVLKALKGIKKGGFGSESAKVLVKDDIKAENVALLKSITPPLSPVKVKWASSCSIACSNAGAK